MAAISEPKVIGDLIKKEADPNWSRRQAVFTNDTGAIASFVVGQTLLLAGDENAGFTCTPAPVATAGAVLLVNLTNVPIAGEVAVPVLASGPCTIDRDQLVYMAGVDGTEAAAQRVTLEAKGIRCQREPLKQGGAADVLT